MNATQLQTTLAPLVAFFAGLLAGKGVFGWDSEMWVTILGAVVGVVGTIWGAIAARKAAMVSTVANMTEVREIDLDKKAPGTKQLENATPDNVKSS